MMIEEVAASCERAPVQGTRNMMESVAKAGSVKRVVITASVSCAFPHPCLLCCCGRGFLIILFHIHVFQSQAGVLPAHLSHAWPVQGHILC